MSQLAIDVLSNNKKQKNGHASTDLHSESLDISLLFFCYFSVRLYLQGF